MDGTNLIYINYTMYLLFFFTFFSIGILELADDWNLKFVEVGDISMIVVISLIKRGLICTFSLYSN